ncbi:NAD(P)-dependent oxidoreductase [Algoriphagus antarcticus]|uniref:Putative NADH-flavin reductase n=1 Tax=Algoriphagus antarcticus TaxID=238540 RepID=A0A3E0D4B0_9BACT|nr:NAD(P)H-binding protein [Algoriphagus antarcticus]REG77549.1 putative NADH-flavin reductase [Algoriphagus antarcticus]
MVKGDVLDFDTINKTIEGCDLVVSLFGHVKASPERLQTNGTENIIKAMKQTGLTETISPGGSGLPFPEKGQPKFPDKLIRLIMKLVFPKIINDAIRNAEVTKNSGLDWVIVGGPKLTDGEKKGNYRSMSRANLADFILKIVESSELICKYLSPTYGCKHYLMFKSNFGHPLKDNRVYRLFIFE